MERWIRFALRDMKRNWKRLLVAGTAFILGIALMAALLVLASGAAAIGLGGLEETEKKFGTEIMLHANIHGPLFEQIFDQNELEEIKRIPGVETITRYTDLRPAFLTRNITFTHTGGLDVRFILTDSFQDLTISSGEAPAALNEIILAQKWERLSAHLRGVKLGEVITFHTSDPLGYGSRSEIRPMDRQEFVVTGFFSYPSSEAFKDTAAFVMSRPEISINAITIRFSDQGHAREAYHVLSERYQGMTVNIHSSLVMDEKSVQKNRQWSSFLLLISIGATAIGSVTLVNSFLFLSLSRRREIGVMRSVGASRKQIMGLFLFEHFTLVVLFLVIGLILGVLLGGGVNTLVFRRYSPEIVYRYGLYAMFPVTWDVLAYPALVALTIGFIASMIPSVKASRMEPVEVLRYEE